MLAPALIGYKDLGSEQDSIAHYKNEVERTYRMPVEALVSDRFANYQQFAKLTRMPELARHLAKQRFYLGKLSIADILIAADLYPLQMIDGITLPIDFLYYLKRVEETCHIDLQQGMLVKL